jgi:hypothetical protein
VGGGGNGAVAEIAREIYDLHVDAVRRILAFARASA